MPTHARLPPSHKVTHASGVVRRTSVPVRNTLRVHQQPVDTRIVPFEQPLSQQECFQADPYVDYGRFLTREGGILFTYKDIDERLRFTLWRVAAWAVATALEAWYLRDHSPIRNAWINIGCLFIIGIVNWLIVRKPVEIHCSAEIRLDCLILDGEKVFLLRYMENGLPAFRQDDDGNLILCGLYGTRFVEYLTARRFDDFDGTPEVFAAHVQAAIQQMWAPALATGAVRPGSPPRQYPQL
jgi:hypothetical protein